MPSIINVVKDSSWLGRSQALGGVGVGDLILFIVLLNGYAAHLCLYVYMCVCIHTYELVLLSLLVREISLCVGQR